MSNYVEQKWQSTYVDSSQSPGGRIAAWVCGVLAVIAVAAYATRGYWYPYAAQWW